MSDFPRGWTLTASGGAGLHRDKFWDENYHGWRYQQLIHRAQGLKIA